MKNISIIFLLFSLIVHDTHARIHWPEGKKAAVILTYDDGLKSQLQIVIPQLEEHNFRGTFFLYGQVVKEEDIPEWRKASQRGHELGNHSMFHPCLSQTTGQTAEPCRSLECYSVKDMLIEIGMMNNFLYAIDGKKRTCVCLPLFPMRSRRRRLFKASVSFRPVEIRTRRRSRNHNKYRQPELCNDTDTSRPYRNFC